MRRPRCRSKNTTPSAPFLAAVLALAGFSGCSYFSNRVTPDRLRHGYTIILPGVEGLSVANSNLAQGLKNSGYPGAIEIDNWTTGSFLLFPVHLRDLSRNRREAWRIAQKITAYQDRYPGRPVHLIGHSGGAGIALLTLEALPPERRVTSVTLLAAAVSPDYDLRYALSRTEAGVWNFYSPLDLLVLGIGTSVLGTVDGSHTVAAGAVGFRRQVRLANGGQAGPLNASADEPPALGWGLTSFDPSHPVDNPVTPKLHQVCYRPSMLLAGHAGGHLGWTWIGFSKHRLAAVLAKAEQRGRLPAWSAESRVSSPVRAPAIREPGVSRSAALPGGPYYGLPRGRPARPVGRAALVR